MVVRFIGIMTMIVTTACGLAGSEQREQPEHRQAKAT
jgi:hypothetical protein